MSGKFMRSSVVPLLIGSMTACGSHGETAKGDQAGVAPQAQSTPHNAYRSRSETRVAAAIHERFSPYATTQLDGGMACVAGAVADEDGMNKKPFVYLREADGRVFWVKAIALPPLTYQARATHCLQQGKSLYVLVQADTQPQQTMSQTLLSIVSLRADDGSVNSEYAVEVPNVSGAYSAWVHGVNSVSLVDGNIIVDGLYFRLDDPEDRRPFKAMLKVNHWNSEDRNG